MRWRSRVAGLVLVVGPFAHAGQVQPVGLLPAEGNVARHGERWLGLFPTEVGWALRRAEIEVSELPAGPSAAQGRARWVDVRAVGEAQPLVILRGVDGLVPGPVPSVEARLDRDGRAQLGPPGVRPWLEVRRDEDGRGGLVLHRGDVELLVVPWTDRGRGALDLLWAGDLDGDGRLDVVLDVAEGDAGARLVVVTSAGAGAGRAGAVAAIQGREVLAGL